MCLLALAPALPPAARRGAGRVEVEHDARLEGYADNVRRWRTGNQRDDVARVRRSSLAIALLGLFKDAKRSHLD